MSFRFFNLHVPFPLLLLALLDGAVFVLSPHVATWLGIGTLGDTLGTSSKPVLQGSIVFALIGLLSLAAMGLYSIRQRSPAAGIVVRVTVGIVATVVLSGLVFYLLPGIVVGRRTLVMAAGIALPLCLALRRVFERLYDEDLLKRRVLVFGAGRRAATLLRLRRRTDNRGFRLIGFMPADGDELAVPADRLVARPPDLFRWAKEHEINEIIVAMEDRRREFPMDDLMECRLAGIDVLELASFLERETGKVRLDVLNPSWIVLGEGFSDSSLQQGLERAFDVAASFLLLVLAAPVMLLTAIAIKLEDGWRAPVLFHQVRVGRYNRPFTVLKFRSMQENAENEGAVWAAVDDPRITKVGSFIRKYRIDELPQLLNVLRGDMSFVGPRPERPEFVEQLAKTVPYYRSRHAVKPGITGWAQLCYQYGSTEQDALEKLQYDLYYVKHRSLIFDLAIVLQTVEVVLWGKGAR